MSVHCGLGVVASRNSLMYDSSMILLLLGDDEDDDSALTADGAAEDLFLFIAIGDVNFER